MLEMTSE